MAHTCGQNRICMW